MAKSNIFKKIKKNIAVPFKKLSSSYICLLLIVFIIALFVMAVFSILLTKYSIENYEPKSNIKMEASLWINRVNDNWKTHKLVTSDWPRFMNEHKNFPSVHFARYDKSWLNSYVQKEKHPEWKDIDFNDEKIVPSPFVVFTIVDTTNGNTNTSLVRTIAQYAGPPASDGDVPYQTIVDKFNEAISMNYDKLYETDTPVPPTTATGATGATGTGATGTGATGTGATATGTPAATSMASSMNLSSFGSK